MKTFARNIFYFSKEGMGSLAFVFWTIAYPIILACFFNFSFGTLRSFTFEKIPVAVEEQSPTAFLLPHIDLFETTIVPNDEEGLNLLEEKQVISYIDDDVHVTFDKNRGTAQTLVLGFMDQFLQVQALGDSAKQLDFTVQHTNRIQQTSDPLVVMFHSLLASVCFYSVFGALSIFSQLQGNRSAFGSRIALSPISKVQFLVSSFFVSMLLNILSNLFVIGFITFVFKVNLFTISGQSLWLLFLGNLCGSALGFAIGSLFKKEEVQLSVALMLNLSLSAMAGLMGLDLKFYINQFIPATAQFNPIALVTDTLYRINFLADFSSYNRTILVLFIITIVLLAIASKQLRRVRYDSL